MHAVNADFQPALWRRGEIAAIFAVEIFHLTTQDVCVNARARPLSISRIVLSSGLLTGRHALVARTPCL